MLFAFGSQNMFGTTSSPTSRAGALGYFVRLYKHESVGMGRFLQINDGETAGTVTLPTTSSNVVVVGQMNTTLIKTTPTLKTYLQYS